MKTSSRGLLARDRTDDRGVRRRQHQRQTSGRCRASRSAARRRVPRGRDRRQRQGRRPLRARARQRRRPHRTIRRTSRSRWPHSTRSCIAASRPSPTSRPPARSPIASTPPRSRRTAARSTSASRRCSKPRRGAVRGPSRRGRAPRARRASRRREGGRGHARAHGLRARGELVVGPVAWTPVSSVAAQTRLDEVGAARARRATRPRPVPAEGQAAPRCALSAATSRSTPSRTPRASATSSSTSTCRRPASIGVGLRASSAAVVRAGGQLVIDRPYELGAGPVARFARLEAERAGTLRVVARVGMDQDFETIELGAWDAAGKPLRTHAPVAGQKATVSIKRVTRIEPPRPTTDEERLAVALGALAARESAHRREPPPSPDRCAPTRRPSSSSPTHAPCGSRAISRP